VQRGQTGRIRSAAGGRDDGAFARIGIILPVKPSPIARPAPADGLQAVLFDMDGVLVNSEPFWFQAETEVMARLGGSWQEGDQHALVGGSMAVTVAYLLERTVRPASPAEVEHWLIRSMVRMLASEPLPVMPGARELVGQVLADGVPYALVTSSERVIMDAVLAGFGPAFPVAVCAEDVSACKPDPEGYLLATAKLSVDPRRCLVIEDSPNGVAAAEAAGCVVAAVPGVVPVPAGPGRLVVTSVADLSLARLRQEFGRLRASADAASRS
jgi:HAD superfamily hydrolase (TIGR01509 family)